MTHFPHLPSEKLVLELQQGKNAVASSTALLGIQKTGREKKKKQNKKIRKEEEIHNKRCALHHAPKNVLCLMVTQAVVFDSFQSLSKRDYYERKLPRWAYR